MLVENELYCRLQISDAVKEDMWNVSGRAAASETIDGVKPESTDNLREIKCNLCTTRVKSKMGMYVHVNQDHPQARHTFQYQTSILNNNITLTLISNKFYEQLMIIIQTVMSYGPFKFSRSVYV